MRRAPRSATSARNASSGGIRGGLTAPPGGGAPGTADTRAVSVALVALLAAIALARLGVSLLPGAWGWGLASLRDVGWPAWVLWAAALALLVPALARPASRALAACGDAWTAPGDSAWPAVTVLAVAAAGAVLVLADRGYFVGDFVLRLGIVRKGVPYAQTFPQALPLDVFVHERVVQFVAARSALDPLAIERALGALRAALLALAGVALARAQGLRGAAAAVVALGTTCTGALALDTGYGKGLADLCLAAAWTTALALRVARGGGGLLPLGACVAAGIGLHRSGLALLVPWAIAVWAALARDRRALASWPARAGVALPPLAAALVLPRVVALLGGIDREHLSPGGAGGAGIVRMALHPLHLADAANVVVLVAPLVLVAPAALLLRGRRLATPTAAVWAALVLPWLAAVLLVHPRQGMVRDWDVFATAGVVIACAAAALLGELLTRVPASRWLAPALVLAAIAPVGSVMLRAHDVDRSLAFAQHALDGPPARTAAERANLHEYRAIVLARDGRLHEGALEFRRAAELIPSPSQLTLWLNSALLARDFELARDAVAAMVERDPSVEKLLMLGRAEQMLGHREAAQSAAKRALALAPGDSTCVAIAGSLGVKPEGGTPGATPQP